MGVVGHRFASGQRVVGSSMPVSFAWTATDTGSGVDHFDIQQRRDGGAWTTVTTGYRRSEILRQLATGHSYQFRVRAVDHVGHVGAWRAGTSFSVSSYQESSTRIRYAGTWRPGSAPAYWGLRDRFATGAGSSASIAVTGRAFAWIGSRGPTRGTARIYVNGALVATVNTWAASAQDRQVLYQLRWSTDATRNVRIVVSGTAGHPRVDLDAIAAFR
jgi:hypothetical protein